MPHDEKDLVHRIAREHLGQAGDPKAVEELEVVFDAVYRTIEQRRAVTPERGDEDGRGLPFDAAAFAGGATVASAIWATAFLVRAALLSRSEGELTHQLARLGPVLVERTRRRTAIVGLWELILGATRELLHPGPPADSCPPDARLWVDEEPLHGQLLLTWRLERPGSGRLPAGGALTLRDPQAYVRDLFQDLGALPLATTAEREAARESLDSAGSWLFLQLPEDLQWQLWSLLDGTRTLQVVSAEPWIPWEMLRLRPPGRAGSGGPFLGEAFAVTRWLGLLRSPLLLPLRSLALVAPRNTGLAGVDAERVHLLSRSDRRIAEVPATSRDVLAALASGRFDGFHFTGHGDAAGSNPDRWGVDLEENDVLIARDLFGTAAGLGGTRPLVVLNACSTGRAGFALTAIGGLAAGFLQAGAGAIVSPRYSLLDAPAAAFVEAFYPLLLGGLPLGEALRQARLALRERFPGDPAWLAYTALGHPLDACPP